MKRTAHFSLGGDLIQRFSNLLVKLLKLNFLTLVFSLPVFTAGASLTAMHHCLSKVIRQTDDQDDGQLGEQFLRAFRENFKQATLLWLPFLLIFASALVNVVILLLAPDTFADWVVVPAAAAAIVTFLLFQFVMPMQAHFENTPLDSLRFAAILAVAYLPRTVLMAVLWLAPFVLFWNVTLSWPLLLLFGTALPGYLCARLCDPVFRRLEENQEREEAGE